MKERKVRKGGVHGAIIIIIRPLSLGSGRLKDRYSGGGGGGGVGGGGGGVGGETNRVKSNTAVEGLVPRGDSSKAERGRRGVREWLLEMDFYAEGIPEHFRESKVKPAP